MLILLINESVQTQARGYPLGPLSKTYPRPVPPENAAEFHRWAMEFGRILQEGVRTQLSMPAMW